MTKSDLYGLIALDGERRRMKSSLPSLFHTNELPRPYPCIFAYGIAGSGKTHMLRTLAPRRPLVLATEAGNSKGMGTLGDLHLPCVLINDIDELTAVYMALTASAKPGEVYYDGAGPFGAVALDSMTGVGVFLEDAVKKLKGWSMIWDAKRGGGKDPRNAYPYIAERGRKIVSAFMALPVPVVITCREQLFTEGEGDMTKTYAIPELPGQKLPRELPGWTEATLRLRSINGNRVFVTQNEGDVIARVRLQGNVSCPKYLRQDLNALIEVLQGTCDVEKEVQRLKADTSTRKTPQQVEAERRRQERAS